MLCSRQTSTLPCLFRSFLVWIILPLHRPIRLNHFDYVISMSKALCSGSITILDFPVKISLSSFLFFDLFNVWTFLGVVCFSFHMLNGKFKKSFYYQGEFGTVICANGCHVQGQTMCIDGRFRGEVHCSCGEYSECSLHQKMMIICFSRKIPFQFSFWTCRALRSSNYYSDYQLR